METPSPLSRFGQKGIGESGAIGPPAAIANAVNDALAEFGAEVTHVPMTPERVLAALAAAQVTGRAGDIQVPGASSAGVFNMGGMAVANYVSILEPLR